MKIVIAISAALATSVIGLAGPAAAGPPVNTDGSGHVHHVRTGNGECHEINAVSWDATENGLHRGANSSGVDSGPWHGPCPA